MKFTILHPTARVHPSFQFPWWKSFQSAHITCDRRQDVEYLLVVHHTRGADFWKQAGRLASDWGSLKIITNYGRDCVADAGNAGRLQATGEIILGSMDDLFFPPQWDTRIIGALERDGDPARPAAIHLLTGSQRDNEIFNPPCWTRALDKLIGPWCPEYQSMFLDNEYTGLFRKYGTVVETAIGFEHRHPAFQTAEMDAVYALENSREAYERGREVFERRRALGFPRVWLPGWDAAPATAPAAPSPEQRTIAMCCPGESHRADWEKAFWHVVAGLLADGYLVRFMFGYSTNVYHVRAGMARDAIYEAGTLGRPDFLLWIDDDNTPTIETVRALIQTLDVHREFSGAAGWCWIRTQDDETGKVAWLPSAGNFKPGTLHLLDTTLAELYADNAAPKEIEWSGFPCLLMRYEAMEQLGPRAFAPVASPDNELLGITGEDIAFFVRAKEHGLRFCVVPQAKVEHWKTQPIEPDYRLSDNASPAAHARLEKIEEDRARRNGDRLAPALAEASAM